MARKVRYPNFIGVSVDNKMLEKLKILAELRECTVSQTVRYIIKQSLNKQVEAT